MDILSDLHFLTGLELPDRTLLIAAREVDMDMDNDPHTLVLMRSPEGEWSEPGHVGWSSIGVSANGQGSGIGLLGRYGKFLEFRKDGHIRADIIPNVNEENPPTVFRFIKSISGQLYAGGTNRYLYQFKTNRWCEVGPESIKCNKQEIGSIESLTGFGPNELYTIGWSGEIWSKRNGVWDKIESPTNITLNDADTLKKTVYIGGLAGTIIEGRGDVWSVVENNVLQQDIWSVQSYGDAVYFSTMSGILRLKNGVLELMKQLGPDVSTTMSLFVGPSGLWSIGASDIVLYDGTQWHTIEQN